MAVGRLDIDLSAIVENWRALGRGGAETGAVVKADAYGLGASEVAAALARAGARTFFVAVAEEGRAVRAAVGSAPRIFVFSGHQAGDAELLTSENLTPLLNFPDQVVRHRAECPGAPYGIQLDTGMNRLGMKAADWSAVRDALPGGGPALVMSHLACADEPDHPMNPRQLARFREMTEGVEAPRSLAATGGILLGPDYGFDLTRPGVGLYGGLPFEGARPVVTLRIPVVQVHDVPEGETVGYATAWTAPRPSRIATIAAGYADGLFRALGPKAHVLAEGRRCPVVGRVSMDLITVDVTDLGHVPDEVELLGTTQGVDDLAEAAGTIGYEILTALGRRYERHYRHI